MNRISSKLSHLVRMACAAGVSASGIAYAQTVKAPPPVQAPAPVAAPATLLDDQWHGGISIGGAAASGNANSVVLSGAADAVKATTKDKISLSGASRTTGPARPTA
jgi:hypothetical protein